MGPISHAALAGGIGSLVWAGTGESAAVPIAVAAGVLVDSDHAPNFILPKKTLERIHTIGFLHAWEYFAVILVVLPLFEYHPLILGALLGYLSHLVLDQISHRHGPFYYSILYRLYHGNDTDSGKERETRRPHVEPQFRPPLWGRLEPQPWMLFKRFRNSR